jgi:hypothetical protein
MDPSSLSHLNIWIGSQEVYIFQTLLFKFLALPKLGPSLNISVFIVEEEWWKKKTEGGRVTEYVTVGGTSVDSNHGT